MCEWDVGLNKMDHKNISNHQKSESGGEGTWRASLEDSHTGKRKGFSSLKDLFTFLGQETGHRARGHATLNAHEKGGDAEKGDA